MKTRQAAYTGLILAASIAVPAHATLIDRGGGLLYDDVLNITWLQDANYARTSGYDADGRMNWNNAKSWAANLVYGGYDDWRLPTMIDSGTPGCLLTNSGTDCGFNVLTYAAGTVYSELAYMYHVNLGLRSCYKPDGTVDPTCGVFGNGTFNGTGVGSHGKKDFALVQNLQADMYWSGVAYALGNDLVWDFYASLGAQYMDHDGHLLRMGGSSRRCRYRQQRSGAGDAAAAGAGPERFGRNAAAWVIRPFSPSPVSGRGLGRGTRGASAPCRLFLRLIFHAWK